MRQIYPGKMVAHLWANQSQSSAKNSGGNFFFADSTIFSYGAHFPIAKLHNIGHNEFCLFTPRTYSNTTAKHINYTRMALRRGVPVYTVTSLGVDGKIQHKKNLDHYRESITNLVVAHKRARTNITIESTNTNLINLVNEANSYARLFKLKTTFAVPTDDEMTAKMAAVKALSAKEQKAKELKTKKLEEALALALEDWRKGEQVDRLHLNGPTAIRLKPGHPETIETTKGAEVPLKDAVRLLPFLRAGRPYKHNGHSLYVGQFRIDEIDEAGNLKAGCHEISKVEIERLASQLGL